MIKKILIAGLPALAFVGCASTPFTFTGENANKGYVVLSLSVSKECIDTGRFDAVTTAMKNVDGTGGRPFNLRNPFAFADFEEDGALFYSFSIKEGEYEFNHISGMTKMSILDGGSVEYGSKAGLAPYKVSIKGGEVNYLGNLHLVGEETDCRTPSVKFVFRDRKDRDLRKAAESQPQLFAAN